MDRVLDLKPEVTQGCGFKSRLWQEVSMTEVRPLSKAPNPQLLPGRRNVGCPLLHLDGLNAENTFITLLIILCIIVYVTNKAHLSLIWFDSLYRHKIDFLYGFFCVWLKKVSCMFGTTWGYVNHDRVFIFSGTVLNENRKGYERKANKQSNVIKVPLYLHSSGANLSTWLNLYKTG